MVGGGIWKTAPGQITDDGELTLSLCYGLRECKQVFDPNKIAIEYNNWANSSPFDIGNTTRSAMGVIDKNNPAISMYTNADKHCMSSKANGSLMRSTPLAIWGHKLNVNELAYICERDTKLSHPNEDCVHAVTAYIIAIVHLLNHIGDRKEAYSVALNWAKLHSPEITKWLETAAQLTEPIPSTPSDGFIRIAFIHAFYHLLHTTKYKRAIKVTLAGGGDTDTNACIVGGMIGAAVGYNKLPTHMKNAVLTCDTSKGRSRDPHYWGKNATILTTQLLDIAPSILKINPSIDHNFLVFGKKFKDLIRRQQN